MPSFHSRSPWPPHIWQVGSMRRGMALGIDMLRSVSLAYVIRNVSSSDSRSVLSNFS